jgi:hypothetical protein
MGAQMSGKPAQAYQGKSESSGPAKMTAAPARESRSKMSQVANAERFNLAVGVYRGFVEAYNRVKPIPRDTAQVSFTEMVAESRATTVTEAVDGLCRRFLSVELEPSRRAAIVAFLREELGSDRLDFKYERLEAALRNSAHLILSAPEYQLD